MSLFAKKIPQPYHRCVAARVHVEFEPKEMVYCITAQCGTCGKLQSMIIGYDAINDLARALMG